VFGKAGLSLILKHGNLDPVITLKAMANSTRVLILQELLDGPHFVNEIVQSLNAKQPTISEHMKVLHSAGVVCKERIARKVIYRIKDAQMRQLIAVVMKLLRNLAIQRHKIIRVGRVPTHRMATK
jgi:DNA-binding transcriptional ArsR family regulator